MVKVLRIQVSILVLHLMAVLGSGCSGQTAPASCVSGDAGGNASATPCTPTGGNRGTGGSSATGGQGGHATSAPDLIFSNLEGYWLTDLAIGDCIDYATYLHFLPNLKVESIRVDNDACYPSARGTFITAGTYSLAGRTLDIDLESGDNTRYDVAIESTTSGLMLRTAVYAPVDDRTWRAVSIDETLDAVGNQTYYNEVQVVAEFSAPIPTSGTGSCQLTTRFRVIEKMASNGTDEDYSGAFDPVSCQYVVSNTDGFQVIQLASQPDGNHPNWVKANVQPRVWRGFRLNPVSTDYLSTPDGWSKQTETPAGI